MMSSVIQTALQNLIPNTFQSIGDEKIAVPYCIHEETDTAEYLKEGLSGYNWQVDIAIIHSTPDAADALAVSVVTAINALGGTTSSGTTIECVEYLGTAPGFDEKTREYMKMISFNIITKNR